MKYILLLLCGVLWGAPGNGGGYFDVASCSALQGWAVDFAATKEPVIVEIYVGSKLITTNWAMSYRPDVDAALKLGPNHGFDIPTPKDLLNVGEITVTARIKDGPQLSNSPKKLKCGDPPLPPVVGPPIVSPPGTPGTGHYESVQGTLLDGNWWCLYPQAGAVMLGLSIDINDLSYTFTSQLGVGQPTPHNTCGSAINMGPVKLSNNFNWKPSRIGALLWVTP